MEYQRLVAQLQAVWRLKQGIENRGTVVASTVNTYEARDCGGAGGRRGEEAAGAETTPS